ncbi:hypothetical protein BJV77DRAFT_267314 [Russula vinacea]|nr:hypothetical protein BJV77DRAFT_267314 [Russula vinacea]
MPHHHVYWHNHLRRYNMLCGPSRLVWFGIGSLVTYAWFRHHRDHCPRVDYHRRGDGRAQWERERERDEAPPPPPSAPNYGEWRQTQSSPSGALRTKGQFDRETQLLESIGITTADHERLRQMGRSAEETISGMSEATIDGMMGALQRLKDRLAERRGQQMQDTGSQQANPTPAASPSPEVPPQPRHWV